jgi:hypothetical protein
MLSSIDMLSNNIDMLLIKNESLSKISLSIKMELTNIKGIDNIYRCV